MLTVKIMRNRFPQGEIFVDPHKRTQAQGFHKVEVTMDNEVLTLKGTSEGIESLVDDIAPDGTDGFWGWAEVVVHP